MGSKDLLAMLLNFLFLLNEYYACISGLVDVIFEIYTS